MAHYLLKRLKLWLVTVAIVAGSTAVLALPPDIRIIVIDDDLFARIDDRAQRLQAVEDMLADIRMFENESPSRLATIVLYRDGQNLNDLSDLSQGASLADTLDSHWLIREIRAGKSAQSAPGFSVYDLRDRVWALAKKYGLHRDGGLQRQIDLHIFANTWMTSSSVNARGLQEGNMQTHDFAGACYAQQDTSTREWYDHVTLAVELRPPDQHENPSPSALFGMMTILAGSSSTNGQVKMRGDTPTGPTCAMAALQDFTDPDINSNIAQNCSAPIYRRPGDDLAARCGAPIAPAIGVGLDRNPIHLVARNDRVHLGVYTLTTNGTGFDLIISTGVGGPILLPGQSRSLPLSATGTYNATLKISPRSGCLPTSTLMAMLSTEQTEIQFAGAYAGCTVTRINLHEVAIR